MTEHEELADQIASRLAVRLGPPPERRLWDLEAVAKFLGIAKGALSNMISAGTFPQHAIKIGNGPASRRWTEKQVAVSRVPLAAVAPGDQLRSRSLQPCGVFAGARKNDAVVGGLSGRGGKQWMTVIRLPWRNCASNTRCCFWR